MKKMLELVNSPKNRLFMAKIWRISLQAFAFRIVIDFFEMDGDLLYKKRK